MCNVNNNIVLLERHLLICQAMVVVDPYAEGQLGFWIYEQFSLIDVEAVLYTKRQQTPNLTEKKSKACIRVSMEWIFQSHFQYTYPAAQLPLAVPPFDEHSVVV